MATYSDAVSRRKSLPALQIRVVTSPGSTFFNPELMAKRLELLKEIAPSMARAGVWFFRRKAINRAMLEAMERTANVLGVELQPIEIDRPTDMESAFLVLADQQVGGFDGWVITCFYEINATSDHVLAEKHRLPSIWTARTSH